MDWKKATDTTSSGKGTEESPNAFSGGHPDVAATRPHHHLHPSINVTTLSRLAVKLNNHLGYDAVAYTT